MELKGSKILLLITEDSYFWLHRLALGQALRDAGCQVVVATRVVQHGALMRDQGFKVIPITLRRTIKNPFYELASLIELIRIYRQERPDLVCHVAVKPILYGSLAAQAAWIPAVVNTLSGLGHIFTADHWHMRILRRGIELAYKIAFSIKNSKTTVENPDDASELLKKGIVSPNKIVLIKGVGIDVAQFAFTPESPGIPLVALASRMLWTKGVGEYVEAVRILRNQGVRARFILVGDQDIANPAAIPRSQLESWQEENLVEWWGHRDSMPVVFAQVHVVCLPSYREGVPRVLMEAASCGRAIVTTDAPGCREVVRHGENGLLVPVRNSKALAEALRTLIENPALRARMGARGREIAVAEFAQEKVIEQTLSVYRTLLDKIGMKQKE